MVQRGAGFLEKIQIVFTWELRRMGWMQEDVPVIYGAKVGLVTPVGQAQKCRFSKTGILACLTPYKYLF